jgi:hypothetical protein
LARELVGVVDSAVALEEAVRVGLRERSEDGLTRAAAKWTSSADSRLWKAAYARSTDRFTALGRFLKEHPGLVETVLAVQRQRSDRDLNPDLVLGWILNLMSRCQLAEESGPSGLVVIDEGFAQRGVALLGPGFDPLTDQALLDAYLGALPSPELVVAVETPLEVCRERLDRRGWSERVRYLDPAERHRFLTSAAEVTGLVAAGIAASGGRLIWVDGTTPVPDSLAPVAATLQP